MAYNRRDQLMEAPVMKVPLFYISWTQPVIQCAGIGDESVNEQKPVLL